MHLLSCFIEFLNGLVYSRNASVLSQLKDPGKAMATTNEAHELQRHEYTHVPTWEPCGRTSHVKGAKALGKVTRNADSYIADLGRYDALHGYELPKKTLARGSHGVVKVRVQLYEEEARLLLEETGMQLRSNFERWHKVFAILLVLPYVYMLLAYLDVISDPTRGFQDKFINMWASQSYARWRLYFSYIFRQLWDDAMGEWEIEALDNSIWMVTPAPIWYWARGQLIYYEHYWIPDFKVRFSYSVNSWLHDCFSPVGSKCIFYIYISICFSTFLWISWRRWFKRPCWYFYFVMDALAYELMDQHVNLSKTQMTTEGVASHPIITTIIQTLNNKLELRDHVKSVKYKAVIRFLIAMKCDNRIETLSDYAGLVITEKPEEDQKDLEAAKTVERNDLHPGQREVVGVRQNTAPLKQWRHSVKTVLKSSEDIALDKERGIHRETGTEDNVPDRVGGIQLGPRLCDVTESLGQTLDNEFGAVSRHLSVLTSKITKRPDGTAAPIPAITPEAEARLNKAATTIGDHMLNQLTKHKEHLLGWSFPLKWGALTWAVMYEYVASLSEYIPPKFAAFVKKNEMALPLNKLPRMVVSQGVEATAAEAEFWCVIENLLKKCYPHLVTKGKSEDEVVQQIADLCRRSKSLDRDLISIDMSSMDASWTVADRTRIYHLVMKVLKKVEADLLSKLELFNDPILWHAKKKAKIRINLHHIRVTIDAAESILFSGERKTSTGNRLLMLMIFGAELIRVYGEEGEGLIHEMLYYPEEEMHFHGEDKDPTRTIEHENDFQYYSYTEGWFTWKRVDGVVQIKPKEQRDVFGTADQNCNLGDGDDNLLSTRKGMYASEEEMMLAWEKYHKSVEVCSPWNENEDAEVLSKFIITTGKCDNKRIWCIPKVQRNLGRLLLVKMQIPPGLFQSNGKYAHTLTKKEWVEFATQLWNRSYSLRHTLVLRRLCAAMFMMCIENIGEGWEKCTSIYDDDGHRMGKLDGDMKLQDMAEEVSRNTNCIPDSDRRAAAYALLKALRFKDIGSDSAGQKRMMQAIIEADENWSELALTDDMCHNPKLFIDSFPIDPELAENLGFTADLVARLKETYLAKEQAELPEVSVPCPTGGTKHSSPDGPKFAAFIMIGDEDDATTEPEKRKILVGEETEKSARAFYVSLPGGKTDPADFDEAKTKKLPFWVCTAIRELREETGYHVSASNLNLVNVFDFCGCTNFVLYTSKDKLSPAAFASGADVHLNKLAWRSVEAILGPNGWHPKRVSENVLRVIHTKGDRLTGVFNNYAYNTRHKYLHNTKQILFMCYEGKECTHKHTYQIEQKKQAYIEGGLYRTQQVTPTVPSHHDTATATSCEPRRAEGRSKSTRSSVSWNATTSVEAKKSEAKKSLEGPPQQMSATWVSAGPALGHHDAHDAAIHENDGHGTGGTGKPPGSRRGMVYGPTAKDKEARETGQFSGPVVEGALSTECQSSTPASSVSPTLEPTTTGELRGSTKPDPDLPVRDASRLKDPGAVLSWPRPPAAQAKSVGASYNRRRPIEHENEGCGRVECRPGKTKVGNLTSGSSPVPDASRTAALSPELMSATGKVAGWKVKLPRRREKMSRQ